MLQCKITFCMSTLCYADRTTALHTAHSDP